MEWVDSINWEDVLTAPVEKVNKPSRQCKTASSNSSANIVNKSRQMSSKSFPSQWHCRKARALRHSSRNVTRPALKRPVFGVSQMSAGCRSHTLQRNVQLSGKANSGMFCRARARVSRARKQCEYLSLAEAQTAHSCLRFSRAHPVNCRFREVAGQRWHHCRRCCF